MGRSGRYAVTKDGGKTFTEMQAGTDDFIAVSFVNDSTGWVSAIGGKLYRTVDGGKNWKPQAIGKSGDILDILFTDEKTGYASTAFSLFSTSDGGASWKALADKGGQITMLPGGELMVGDGSTFRIKGDTAVAVEADGSPVKRLVSLSASRWFGIIGADVTQALVESTDAGKTWSKRSTYQGVDQKPISGVVPDLVLSDPIGSSLQLFRNRTYAYGAKLYSSKDGGATWATADSIPFSYALQGRLFDATHGWLMAATAASDGGTPPYLYRLGN